MLSETYLVTLITKYHSIIGNTEPVVQRVLKSTKCNRFVVESIRLNITPSADDLIATVLSSRYFAFSKAETVCLASLFLLQRFIVLRNKAPRFLENKMIEHEDEELSKRSVEVLNKCSVFKLSSNKEFFIEVIADALTRSNLESSYTHQELLHELNPINIDEIDKELKAHLTKIITKAFDFHRFWNIGYATLDKRSKGE